MPPSSRWIAVGAAVSIALVVYGLFALYDMAREDALRRVASLTTEQADATAPPPDPMRDPEPGDTTDNGEADAAVDKPPEPESTVAAVPEPAEDGLTLEEGQATTPADSPTDNEVPSSAASDEQAEGTVDVETTTSEEDPLDSSAGPPESEDSAGQPQQVETQVPAGQAGDAASPPEEGAVSSAAEDQAAAPPAAVEPEPADPGTETEVGSGGEADPPDSPVAQQDEAPASPTTVVAEPAGEPSPAPTSARTGEPAGVDPVVAPAPEPAATPEPVGQEDAETALAEAEATPPAPLEDTPPATAGSETGDVPVVEPVVAPTPEPVSAPEPIDLQDAEPALAEAEATLDKPGEETPSATARSETGDVPEVDPVVTPAPEPAAAPQLAEQEDPEPVLADVEVTSAEPAEETPSATARSETGDVPAVAEIVAPAPEPAEPRAPVVREDTEPALAEAEATPPAPTEETPPVTAGSETGGVPEVDPLVASAPEPTAEPEPIEPQDAEPALAEAETTPDEHAEASVPAPSTDGSERAAEQEEPATTPLSEAQTADGVAAEPALTPESPDTASAVRADGPGPDDGVPSEAPAAQQVAALPEAPADATAPDRAGAAILEESPPGPESTAPPPPEDVAQFDVVQVSPDGTVVVAGRTAPGSQVELVVDGEVIATADTNRNGEFVFVPDVQLLPGVRELSIAALSPDVPDRRTASRIVVVLIPDREMLAARVTEPTESTPSEAPIALLVDEQGETVGVIQPSPSMAEPDTVLSLTTVTFDEDGYASITGGGEAGQKVTVYLDNEVTGSTIIGENGYWTVRIQHPLAKTGSYKVRIDQTAPNDDTVTERIVTTLIRAGGKLIPAAATVVTVVKGNTLWGISRRHYGRGILYTLIYDSNSYQIADPHWIYPGQKFLIPERN
ncbi:MAG: LysM peptidoglycan-binding domain-containing protein [Rhodospirillales bacterium]|nr:LysM peptidoglycan-binding domain-containing protein [Rhodospirillales bacterium]